MSLLQPNSAFLSLLALLILTTAEDMAWPVEVIIGILAAYAAAKGRLRWLIWELPLTVTNRKCQSQVMKAFPLPRRNGQRTSHRWSLL
jgi:hypothetical protein